MNDVLKIHNLTAGYGKKPVLKDLRLNLEEGKVYALIGPNGSGKSTLLKTILKETTIFGGAIQIEGKDIEKLSQKELSEYLSFVPQKATVPEGFTVEEVLDMSSFANPKVTKEVIQSALKACGIEKLEKRIASELSGGELQLVLLARCIAVDTPLILLDEPSSSLDINNQSRLLSQTKELAAKGKTILMTVHDLNVVFRNADEVIVMKDGVLYSRGTAREVITETMLKEVYSSDAKIHQATDGETFIC